MDYLHHPHASQRMTTIAKNGMVATSQPLAAQAGLDILKRGGNAIDAAIATAACLTVVEPTSNGIGGDAYALVWVKDKLHGLNASGPAPQGISIEGVKNRGYEKIPTHGWIPVTVPGIPAAWAALSERFGKLSLQEVLEPAIHYANKGFPISPILGKHWANAYNVYKNLEGAEYQEWLNVFAPNDRAPQIGEMWSSPDHGRTLAEIGRTNGTSFYKGELAERISAASTEFNGFLRYEDLASFKPEWVDPISINYRGYDVWEIPPNGQGIVALMALNMLKGFKLRDEPTIETYHQQIEAMKLAFADGKEFVTDSKKMKIKTGELLSESYAAKRSSLITDKALLPEPGTPSKGGTVYLATADSEGNMVSFIQSNYMGFGSGVVVPGTGIALQNRGHDFSLDPNHVNALYGGKKTFHTIIPGFLTKNDRAVGPFGVMGGYMQPQGHLQVVMNMVDFHLNPQAALDAPRWQWIEGTQVVVEPSFPTTIAQALHRKGHNIQVALDSGSFGRGQIICRDQNSGVLFGGTESRTDGSIAAF
ncbi:gamma-glutamyltransferase family protein [Metabacillus herbersteinensis]|uniref:Gamma-glutamyltransferase family protein n=1 Tax=Metabacillus herbersteinensis TaxID=283816 RepID=A0ABV6GBN6_9BACI